ncbi:hypothetical protein LCGC14_2954400, partial [marine sediment metagenome]
MIKFSGTTGKHGDRRLLGICLSRVNTERLLAGQPILFKA